MWARMRTANTGRFKGVLVGLVRLWWCAVGVGLCLWLDISACVGLSVCGVCSCVGGARVCALWGVYSALWLWCVVSVMRCADALRGNARTVGAFGIARRMARTVNAWRRGTRDGRSKEGERVCPPLLGKGAIFGRVTPSHRNYKYF